jgi:hypothetical protein
MLCSQADLQSLLRSRYADEVSDVGTEDIRRICEEAVRDGNPFIHDLATPIGGTDLDVMPVMEFLAHAATVGAFLLAFWQYRKAVDRDKLIDEIAKRNQRYQRELLLKTYIEVSDYLDNIEHSTKK